MAEPNRRIRWSTPLFVVAIAALVCSFALQQRKEERLRAALAAYKSHSHEKVINRLHYGVAILNWPEGTPLGEVIEQIKLNTRRRSAFQMDVPVVIDPAGLEVAGKSLSSPVRKPPADQELSLGQKLQAVLKPLGLACQVNDATIVITSERKVDEPLEDKDDDQQ